MGQRRSIVLTYAAAALGASVGAAFVLKLWHAHLGVPFSYGGDADLNHMAVKSVVEQGLNAGDRLLGWPFGQHLGDFPFLDYTTLALAWLVGLTGASSAVAMNAVFLLGFPLAAVAAAWVLVDLGVSRPAAAALGAVYALLPYHFVRGETHLFLSTYFAVPLGCWLALSLLGDRPPFASGDRRRNLAGALAVVLVGSAVQYYVLFALVLVLAAAAGLAVQRRPSRLALGVAAAVLVVFLVNLAPSVVYRVKHGPNPEVAHRNVWETNQFGLKLGDLLMPITEHRLAPLRHAAQTYRDAIPIPEFDSPALGGLAAGGFLFLLGVTVASALGGVRSRTQSLSLRTRHAAFLAVAALLASLGAGLVSVAAAVVGTPIRAFNRMSIFIAFFAFVAVAEGLDRLRPRLRAVVHVPLIAGLAVLAVLDQTSPAYAPRYAHEAAVWNADQAFVRRVAATLPQGSAVLQLPHLPFPENGPLVHVLDYEPLRGPLHTDRLHWTYGAVKGRAEDWSAAFALAPPEVAVRIGALAGCRAVWLQRGGYEDGGAAAVAALQAAASGPVLTTLGEDILFAPITPDRPGPLRELVLHPVYPRWASGFSPLQQDAVLGFRVAEPGARLRLENPLPRARRVRVQLRVDPVDPSRPVVLDLAGNRVGGGLGMFDIDVPAGGRDLLLRSDAGPLKVGRLVLLDVEVAQAVGW
ncbi:MAG TPA: hypothetical protein VGO92_02220 [Acidimicrobiales bacterium]|jgi:phosphoglycerol transferase|nr:hypothetical protein [Acidimicrobiales bacterium]